MSTNVLVQRMDKLRDRNDNQILARIKKLTCSISGKAVNRGYHAAPLNASFSRRTDLRQVASNKCSGQWLYDAPPFWSREDYIKTVQLRFNLLPYKGIPSNRIAELRRRRERSRRQETVCNILHVWNTIPVSIG